MPEAATLDAVSGTAGDVELACMTVWGGNGAATRHVLVPGLDAWLHCSPHGRAETGGDVYLLSSCASGRIVRAMLADVSGHGAEASAAAAALRRLMKGHLNQLDQRRLVRALNRKFHAVARAGRFATALVATYFAPTGTLSLTNAGHPPPLRYDAARGRWECLTGPDRGQAGDDVPLGVLGRSRYRTRNIGLAAGDLVLCYTDAVIECRGHGGETLGPEGLARILCGMTPPDPVRVLPHLCAALRELDARNLASDDATLLLLAPNDRYAAPSLGGALRLHAGAVSGLVRALLTPGEPVPWPDLHVANLGGAFFDALNRRWKAQAADGE